MNKKEKKLSEGTFFIKDGNPFKKPPNELSNTILLDSKFYFKEDRSITHNTIVCFKEWNRENGHQKEMGYVTYYYQNDGTPYIENIFVKEKYRRQGVARNLIRALMKTEHINYQEIEGWEHGHQLLDDGESFKAQLDKEFKKNINFINNSIKTEDDLNLQEFASYLDESGLETLKEIKDYIRYQKGDLNTYANETLLILTAVFQKIAENHPDRFETIIKVMRMGLTSPKSKRERGEKFKDKKEDKKTTEDEEEINVDKKVQELIEKRKKKIEQEESTEVSYKNQIFEIDSNGILDLSNLGIKDLRNVKGLFKQYSLKGLNLSENALEIIPKETRNLKDLKSLNIDDNNISSIPKEIGNLKNLESLNIRNNIISEIPTEIEDLINLKWLKMEHNNISEIPTEIANLTELRFLGMNYNDISKIPKEISNLMNLETLKIGNNNISKIPKEIANLPNLQYLDIAGNWDLDRDGVPNTILNNKDISLKTYRSHP